MRLVLRLTTRLLRATWGRTLMALLAIVLAAAMLTAIVGFLESAENAMRDQVIAQNGRQHIQVTGLNALQQMIAREHSAVQEAWTDAGTPGTLNIRLTREFLKDPEAALKSAPLSALAVAFADAQVDLNLALIAMEAPGAPSPLGEGFVRMTEFLMAVVVASAIVVIANGFAISLSERTRRIGLLRSAGASAGQMYASVLFEAFLLALLGIPLGIAVGVLLQWAVLSVVMAILGDAFADLTGLALRPALSWRLVLAPALVTLATVFVSALRPARRAARIAPLTAVRETGEVFVRPRDARTPRWAGRLFGLEGVLALRTMRRNRRKYLTGILALTAAAALFISVASFASMAQRSASTGMEGAQPYDLLLELGGPDAATLEKVDALVAAYAPAESVRQQDLRLQAVFPTYASYVSVVPIAEDSLRAYAQAQGIDAAPLLGDGPPAAIFYDRSPGTMFPDGQPDWPLALPLLAHGAWGEEPSDETPFMELSLIAQADAPHENASPYGSSVQLYLSQAHYDQVFAALSKALGARPARERFNVVYGLSGLKEGDFPADARALLDEQIAQGDLLYGVVNEVGANQGLASRLLLVVKLFVYGFIFMLTLIAVTSVVSTLSTGVGLRRRQFALLRSAGMTPDGVRRTLRMESVLYAAYTCVLGIPLGLGIAYAMHRMLNDGLPFAPAWGAVLVVIPAAFLISWLTLMLSSRKLITLRIADTLRGL